MRRIVPLVMLLGAAACGPGSRDEPPRTVQPGAPGEATREVARGSTKGGEAVGYTQADVAFMQAMIPHHAQALVMTALVPDRTKRRHIRLAAERIETSQRSEIELMRRWLESRGEEVPSPEAARAAARHAGEHASMHGMASPEELARLEAARDEEFDRLFLELMIRHHEGALTMTRDLLAHDGAGREPELFQFVSHVDADQRAEIARMRRMLNASTQ